MTESDAKKDADLLEALETCADDLEHSFWNNSRVLGDPSKEPEVLAARAAIAKAKEAKE